jgi:amidase
MPSCKGKNENLNQRTSFGLIEATIDDIQDGYRSGRLTARQLVQMYLDRIEAYDKHGPAINSIITINGKALAEAEQLDAVFKTSGPVGPLHGISVIVKDQVDVKGMPTTLDRCCSKTITRTETLSSSRN